MIFHDIEMPGFGGFEVIQQLSNVPAIVFVTAYDKYAVRAFEANALDYLLKPVQPERLRRALERIRQRFAKSAAERAQEQDARIADASLRMSATTAAGPLKRLAARRGKRIAIVPLREIIRINSRSKTSWSSPAPRRNACSSKKSIRRTGRAACAIPAFCPHQPRRACQS